MQQETRGNIEILDLTLESDEEEKIINETPPSPLIDILHSEDENDSHKSEDEDVVEIIHENDNRKEFNKQRSPSKSPRDTYKSLDKAVEEIRKGGSLVLTAQQYGIPEHVLYDKLVSRNLPDVTTLLTRADEENLVKWILSANQCNSLVFKNNLLEKVGKLKKISRITPIFHKSKYGRLWYFHFLSSHPQIYENEGVLLKCESTSERRRPIERHINEISDDELTKDEKLNDGNVNEISKVESSENEKDLEKLVSTFNIKKAVVILHDFRNQIQLQNYHNGMENVPTEMKENKHENSSSSHKSNMCSGVTQSDETICTGKDMYNSLFSKYKKKRCEVEKQNLKPFCKICCRTFYDKYKLKRHLLVIHPSEDQLNPSICSECSKPFSTKYRLNVHLKLTHNTVLHKCNFCDQTFKHKSSLRTHRIKKHTSDESLSSTTKFECDICGKCFNFKKSLKDHIIYEHLKEKKKYVCSICGKGFIKLSHLNRHSTVHTKERPYICLNCDSRFSRKYLLRKHLQICGENNANKLELECDRISKEYLEELCLD